MNWFIFFTGALFFIIGFGSLFGLQSLIPLFPLKLDRFGMGLFCGNGMTMMLLSTIISKRAA